MPKVNPAIMVWARETAGLTQEEAARKLGFRDSSKSSAVEKLALIERGQKEPSRPKLLTMAGQYRRPLGKRATAGWTSAPCPKVSALPLKYSALDAVDPGGYQSMVRVFRSWNETIKHASQIASSVYIARFVSAHAAYCSESAYELCTLPSVSFTLQTPNATFAKIGI